MKKERAGAFPLSFNAIVCRKSADDILYVSIRKKAS